MEAEKKPTAFWKGLGASAVVLSVALYFAADFAFRTFTAQRKPSEIAFDVPYRSRVWYAAHDFLKQPKTPDLVLFGASDMTCGLYGGEATYLKKTQNQLLKHNSVMLSDKMTEYGSSYKSNFCLGIPGEMPSDAYFLAKTLFPLRPAPKAVAYTITMRDFCDATFGDVSSTDIYKLMSKLGGTRQMELDCRNSIWDKLDYQLGQIATVYGHKWELMSWQHKTTQWVLSKLLPQKYDSVQTPLELRRASLSSLPEDFASNEVMQAPFDKEHLFYLDNKAEYQARYRQFKPSIYKEQFEYLRKFCEICQEHGIHFVLFNSPLTADNKNMIPPQLYAAYLAQAAATAHKYGGTFVDLDKPDVFKHDDFFDSIHLNGFGGQKFLDQIADSFAQKEQLASTSKPPAE